MLVETTDGDKDFTTVFIFAGIVNATYENWFWLQSVHSMAF